jgi:protein-tyrosine phosphatase
MADLFLRAALGSVAVAPAAAAGAGRATERAVVVGSAGTWTPGGEPMWPSAAQEVLARGLSPEGFVSRRLTPALVQDADVVLAATRALRDEVVTLVPAALRKTFTWRELAWLVEGLSGGDVPGGSPAERLRSLPVVVGSRRGHLIPPPGEDLDIEDPVGQPAAAVSVAADAILAAALVISEQLRPVSSARHRRA